MANRSSEGSGQAFTGSFDEATKDILPDAWVTQLHLLRHGEVDRHTSRVVRGQLDVALSPGGLEQTRRAVAWFQACEAKPDLIVSSDLVRCQVMAQQLSDATGAELQVTKELREQNLGAWQGRTWPEVTAEDGAAVTAYWDDYLNARPTGGESYADLHERVGNYWAKQASRWRDRRVVFVTHIGVIRSLLCRALNFPPSEALRFAPAVGSHTSLSLSEAGAVLNGLGERPWLDESWGHRATTRRDAVAPLRVAMSGSAGTGKTTLARRLAQDLKLTYIEEGMRRRLEAGFDLHTLRPDGHRALVREMWEEQLELERAAPAGSIADRSPLDFAAFWLHYGLYEDEAETKRFLQEMGEACERYDAILLCPHGVLPLESDGVRSTNSFIQLRFQALVEGMIERELPSQKLIRCPETASLEERVTILKSRLREL